MNLGIEYIELWWIFPLVCIAMMLFCMLSGFKGQMRCCGSHRTHDHGDDSERAIPNDTEARIEYFPGERGKTNNENEN